MFDSPTPFYPTNCSFPFKLKIIFIPSFPLVSDRFSGECLNERNAFTARASEWGQQLKRAEKRGFLT